MKAFKAFIEPFEGKQRSVKIKISVNFLFVRDRDWKGQFLKLKDKWFFDTFNKVVQVRFVHDLVTYKI